MIKYLRLTIPLFFFFSTSFAQTLTVSGKVTDTQKSPMPGLNVVIKGTTKGTITDADGNYSITCNLNDVLVFSFVGYQPNEQGVMGRSTINVVMKEDQQELGEVVVLGYNTEQSVRNLSTSVSVISADDIQKIPVASLDQAIQGRAAGVQVIKNTGAPGGGVSVRIRGTASINGNQEPLYVIDGVPINNTFSGSTSPPGTSAGGRAGNEVINGMAGINTEDIESITILKDAASASIYGARAANGVVVITTKRGRTGNQTFNFDFYYGLQSLGKKYDLLNADQFAAVVNEGISRLQPPNPVFIKDTPYDTDWQDEIFQVAPQLRAALSTSGGNEKIQYFVSASYLAQEGIVINSGFDRFSYRTNLDYKINDKIKVGTNLTLSYSNNLRLRNNGGANVQDTFNGNSTFGPSIIGSALVYSPLVPVYRPDGSGFASDSLSATQNPVALAKIGEISNSGIRTIGNIFVDLQLLKGLTFRTLWGADIRDENETALLAPAPGAPTASGGSLTKRSFRELIWNTSNVFTYKPDFPKTKHSLTTQAGFELTSSKNDGYWVGVAGITVQGYETLGAGTRVITPYSDGDNSWGMQSYFGRFFYNFDNRYSVTGAARLDGSSRFGRNRQYGLFPSASASWTISNEKFFPASRLFSELKVRTSYGITGNDQIPPFGWRAAAQLLPTNYIGYNGIVPISIQNENYSWESTAQLDIGLDVRVLDRFNFTFDYYNRQTSGLLLFVQLPRVSGFPDAIKNVGRLENTGFEFALTGDVMKGRNFTWTSSFNISFNEVRSVDVNHNAGIFGYSHIARPEQPISIQLYQLEKTVDPLTGNRRVKDLNENGRRDEGDLRVVGSPFPKHIGGFTNNFLYKNFELSLFFQWSYGNKLINNTRGMIQDVGKSNISRIGTNLSTEALGRWTKPGDVASFPGINYGNNADVSSGLSAAGVPTDQNLEDGSYLRLKNVNLSYNLPSAWLKKHKLTSARFYLTLNNLLTFTRYSGFDPEVNHSGAFTNIGVGIDDGTYPQARVFLLGVNVGL
jgi:TonB-dependent starch-binding outer membrane protein SusC